MTTDAIDEVVERIIEFLSGGIGESSGKLEYPYFLRDDFLSRAEHNFFMALRSVVPGNV